MGMLSRILNHKKFCCESFQQLKILDANKFKELKNIIYILPRNLKPEVRSFLGIFKEKEQK